TLAELNAKGMRYVDEALRSDPRPGSIEDPRFLMTMFQVHQPLIEALADFHAGMEKYLSSPPDTARVRESFRRALVQAARAQEAAEKAFPNPIDPSGGEVGIIRTHSLLLVEAIKVMLGRF